jgi:hypothetical protein
MPTIIGNTKAIKYLKAKKKKKSRATGAYRARNERLPDLGYAGYVEYLKSPEWAEIKAKVYAEHKDCCRCGRPAEQLHHWSYDDYVLMGLCNEHILPICDPCHEFIEFDGARKRPIAEVRAVLRSQLLPHYAKRLEAGFSRLAAMRQGANAARRKREKDQRKLISEKIAAKRRKQWEKKQAKAAQAAGETK